MYENYCNYIKLIINDDINQINFKSNSIYNAILEHVSKEIGDDYLSAILNNFGDIFNNNFSYITKICKLNDYIGKPKMYDFSNFIKCSPSNLRYILHSFLILNYMKNCKLNNVNIIEIGGGYGGLCFYLYKLCHIFEININSYIIFDLDEPLLLQKKYLSYHNIFNVKYYNLQNYDKEQLHENSFLVSNYAFSEIPIEIQNNYTKNILNPYISHGFLTWNHIDVYNFISDKNVKIEQEFPLTGNGNKYIYFE
jgi:hypothetical protein